MVPETYAACGRHDDGAGEQSERDEEEAGVAKEWREDGGEEEMKGVG